MAAPGDLDNRDERLSELLSRYAELRRTEPGRGVGILREQAGSLFPLLLSAVEMEEILRQATGEAVGLPTPPSLGRYRILSVLGRGACGEVYRALDTETGLTVALKLMRASLAASPEMAARFRQEASAVIAFSHPNVVRTFDQGELDGRLYLAMELVDGYTLADVLEDLRACGPLPGADWLAVLDRRGIPPAAGPDPPAVIYAKRICALLAPAARALADLGRAGLIHRDLKPQNILITSAGEAKISDFGLVKVTGHELTVSSAILGTPAYMSPEQAGGESRRADHRTDVYGFGAVLYAALTLGAPAAGDNPVQVLARIAMERPPSIRMFCPDYPEDLALLVSRCIERDPADRLPDAGLLAENLSRFSRGARVHVRRIPALRRTLSAIARRPAPAIAAATLLAALLAGALLWSSRPAHLEVECIPSARVTLDGEPRGPTPWKGEVPSGSHRLELARDRFRSVRRNLRVSAGERRLVSMSLIPENPFHRGTLALLADADGLPCPLPVGDPARRRSPPPAAGAPWTELVEPVLPRGLVTRDGLEVLISAAKPVDGLGIRIEPAAGGAAVFRAEADAGEGETRVAIPEEVRAAMGPGPWRLVLTRAGSEESVSASFTVVEGVSFKARGEAVEGRLGAGAHARVLAIGGLLSEGLDGEALLAADHLAREHPGIRLPLRIALEALERLGLGDGAAFRVRYDRWLLADPEVE